MNREKSVDKDHQKYIRILRSKTLNNDRRAEDRLQISKAREQYEFEKRRKEAADKKVKEEILRQINAAITKPMTPAKTPQVLWSAFTPFRSAQKKEEAVVFSKLKSPSKFEQKLKEREAAEILERAKREHERERRNLEVFLNKTAEKIRISDKKRRKETIDLKVEVLRLEMRAKASPVSGFRFKKTEFMFPSKQDVRLGVEEKRMQTEEEEELNDDRNQIGMMKEDKTLLEDLEDNSLDTELLYDTGSREKHILNDLNMRTPEKNK